MREPPDPRFRMPALPKGFLARDRLGAEIASYVETADLVVITARAGAGKSAAVGHALARAPGTAWLNLDRSDTDAGRLVAHLAGALECPPSGGRASASAQSPGERAALLARATRARTLVLDGTERLTGCAESWSVVESLLHHGPPDFRLVLLGRTAVPPALCRVPLSLNTATFPADSFDLTPGEIRALLDALGSPTSDPDDVLERTGGWLTAVRRLGASGVDDLGDLFDHVMAELPSAMSEFLVRTSVLHDVTPRSARSLGLTDIAARFQDLRRYHLPGRLSDDGRRFRCFPVFRDQLRTRFEALPDAIASDLRTRLGRSYLRAGQTEAGVTELMRAGATAEVSALAEAALMTVIDRGDFALAQQWLDALVEERPDSGVVIAAELMLAIAQDDFTRGVSIVDRLEAAGTRDALAASAPRAAAMMAWCYLHQGKPERLTEILALTESESLAEAVGYAAWMISDPGQGTPPVSPPLRDEPSDALILITNYTFGRPDFLQAQPVSEWVRIVSQSGRIAALRAAGRLTDAMREHDEIVTSGRGNLALGVYIGPELLIDAELHERARAAVDEGRALAEATGSVGYRALNAIAAAKFELRLADDPAAARRIINDAAHLIRGREFRLITAGLDTWYGLALLKQNVNLAAAKRLRRAVANMRSGHRELELAIAATYLSEAEWRLGDEAEADRAAEVALRASTSLGSNHQLLRALRDFPDVVARQIDRVPGADSEWHVLGRALLGPHAPVAAASARPRAQLRLHDFGAAALEVDGRQVTPRIAKAYELVALLSTRPHLTIDRLDAISTLFPEHPTRTAATYLRQACHHVRRVLNDPSTFQVEGGHIRFAPDVVLQADSVDFESGLTEANYLAGPERVDTIAEVLALIQRGTYLARVETPWVLQRRQRLADGATALKFDAAELCFSLGRLNDADNYCQAALGDDPYRESAWRLRMKIANALGDEMGVLHAFRQCSEALTELGTDPAASTHDLLARLRR